MASCCDVGFSVRRSRGFFRFLDDPAVESMNHALSGNRVALSWVPCRRLRRCGAGRGAIPSRLRRSWSPGFRWARPHQDEGIANPSAARQHAAADRRRVAKDSGASVGHADALETAGPFACARGAGAAIGERSSNVFIDVRSPMRLNA